MVQPVLIQEAVTNAEARDRGLLGRLLSVPLSHPVPLDDGHFRDVDKWVQSRWWGRLQEILNGRFKQNAEPQAVKCSAEAREVLRDAHNQSVEWINGIHQDLRAWLVRYREICCRVALCLQIAEDPKSTELSRKNAEGAISLVYWSLGQLSEMLHTGRTESLIKRMEALGNLIADSDSGYITFRGLRRKGYSEAEIDQMCALEGSPWEIFTHAAEGGAPPSRRVRLRGAEPPTP